MTGVVPMGEDVPRAHIVTVSSKENAMRKRSNETTRVAGPALDERTSKGGIMKWFEGGSNVKGGFYFNQQSWDLVTVSGKHGVLPGPSGDLHLKIPVLLMLLAAPVIGATLVIFLPLAGIALFVHAGYRKVVPARAAAPKPAPARS